MGAAAQDHLDRLLSVGREADGQPGIFQQLTGNLLIDDVIFYHQDPGRLQNFWKGRFGSMALLRRLADQAQKGIQQLGGRERGEQDRGGPRSRGSFRNAMVFVFGYQDDEWLSFH